MKNNSSSGGVEEDKSPSSACHVTRYSQPKKEYMNPLIHNKGSAHFGGSKELAGIISKDHRSNPSIILPHLIIDEEEDYVVKKDSLASACSNTSEFDSKEKQQKAHNLYLIPYLFEVHSAVQLLFQGRQQEYTTTYTAKQIKSHSGIEKQKLIKSHSIRTEESNSVFITNETLLSEVQKEFFKKVNSITTNYMSHVLNSRDVYFQYVALSKNKMEFSNSQDFLDKIENLMKQKRNYEKNPKLSHSKN